MLTPLRNSLVERTGRERARILCDDGTFKELLGPFDEMESPHLVQQGIVPQSDDGVIIAKGKLNGQQILVISIEGNFQGGGIGEVSGAKIAGALELALKDNKAGMSIYPIFIFDTGGVRLQEANYGLLSIAEIGSAIVELRTFVPVIGIIPGKIGAFGGMSITAGLCSALIMTREGRLGLNGPEVIEQEAGIRELDSMDRLKIWNSIGGKQRVAAGFAEIIMEDDAQMIMDAILSIIKKGIKMTPKSSQVKRYLTFLGLVEPSLPLSPEEVIKLWGQTEDSFSIDQQTLQKDEKHIKSEGSKRTSRGGKWFHLLTNEADNTGEIPSVLCADSFIGNKPTRFLAIVPNEINRFPRARSGEFGLEEGWMLAKHIREAIEEDQHGEKRAIVAIVDVPGQAYGYREELLGIHQACAAAVDAYASARLAGHPIIGFIPGKAISGAFLSHGLQANRLLALDDEGVNVHVMSKQSAARITQRSLAELEEATKKVPAMAYDIQSFKKIGSLFELITKVNANNPGNEDRQVIIKKIMNAIEDIENNPRDLSNRLTLSDDAKPHGRSASILVRQRLEEQWD
ncbi:biotin-independent malonate decarboxylase subunit beta [Rossellomorea sp. BNER]|uniref:biotin-independent malonate decarboxylase subunit beta n=1 Tax=Rossellomorea sp. BNER TaxID=2962031 RepID=UPI003AF204EA|nr:biotin-independent malonate decarboxylase subunit beta [Rossellomorea sp. BNER]